jgi:hypothetical protein
MMSRKERIAWIVGGTSLTVFIFLQFVPVWWIVPQTTLSNPPIVNELQWNSAQTADMMERACYMCHSNETRLPLYMQVAPLSWIASQRVNNGRAHLNFSEQRPEDISLEDLIAAIESGEMPPAQYLFFHPEANLSEEDRAHLIAGIRATFDLATAAKVMGK